MYEILKRIAPVKKEYIPAQLRVIVVAPQRIICDSGSSSGDTPGPTELTLQNSRHVNMNIDIGAAQYCF